MKYRYRTSLTIAALLLLVGCGGTQDTPKPLKRPKVHQIVDADMIVEENTTTEAGSQELPYVYDNVDAVRGKDLENNQDNGNYLNEQIEQSNAVAKANEQFKRS